MRRNSDITTIYLQLPTNDVKTEKLPRLNKPDTQDCLKQSDTFQLLSSRSKTGALPTCLGGWRGRM